MTSLSTNSIADILHTRSNIVVDYTPFVFQPFLIKQRIHMREWIASSSDGQYPVRLLNGLRTSYRISRENFEMC